MSPKVTCLAMEDDNSFVPYDAQRRALAPSNPLFEAGNWRRDLLANDNALMATHRMNVFRCLVEGCGSTFSSAAQRRQHLLDLHQIPLESCFDRVHLTVHQGQLRPNSNAAANKSGKSRPGPASGESATAPQVDTLVSPVIPAANDSGAQASLLSQSTYERQATHMPQRQCNAQLEAHNCATGLPQQNPGGDLNAAQPHLPQYPEAAQTKQQTADAGPVQCSETGGKDIMSSMKQSKGGRGAPLGQSGRGRGRGRHRVALG